MASNLQAGEVVYVPRSRLGLDLNAPNALMRTTVRHVANRTVRVDCPGEPNGKEVASSAVHRNAGILLVRIGDLQTETSLLDPLAKSLLQYCRLLVPDDMISLWELRTREEFSALWNKHHNVISHIVLMGHGSRDGITFGISGQCFASDLAQLLAAQGASPKSIISLCCRTGYATFSKSLSRSDVCNSVISPFHSIHGAIASQFTQSFFAYHFLEGETVGVAFRHAREAVPGATSFRLWRDGCLKAGQT